MIISSVLAAMLTIAKFIFALTIMARDSANQLLTHLENLLKLLLRLTNISMQEPRHHQVSSESVTIFISLSAELLAVGSQYPGSVKTERYLTQKGRWELLEDYPYDWESKINFSSILKTVYWFKWRFVWTGPIRSTVSRWCFLCVWGSHFYNSVLEYNRTTRHKNYQMVKRRVSSKLSKILWEILGFLLE